MAIKNGQSRETGNIEYTRRRKTKQINVREYRRDNQNGQSRETGNIEYTRRKKKKQTKKHNTICAGHHYIQATQTTGGKDEPNIVLMLKSRPISYLYIPSDPNVG